MPEVLTAAASNGAPAPSVRERVAEQLRAAIAELVDRRDDLAAELAGVNGEIKMLERSLAPLAPPDPNKTRPGRPPKADGDPVRKKPAKVGPERMARVEAVVRELGKGDAEFRQVDVREQTGLTSSIMTSAFRQLREDDVVRLARREGINQWFKLTRPALREGEH
jgi:hypothetical protein